MGMDAVEIILDLESTFNIEIVDADLVPFETVTDVYHCVLRKISSNPTFPITDSCNRCDYLLRGLETNNCPECGEPFRPSSGETLEEYVWGKVRRILAYQLGVKVEEITADKRLAKDLGMD